jgi:hypothetical protein
MSNTKEQELKPCRCGSDHVHTYVTLGNNKWCVECCPCYSRLVNYDTEAEAIAAWNQYVDPAPAPQWTSNLPTEPGWYVVFCGNELWKQPLRLYKDDKGKLCVAKNRCFFSDFVHLFDATCWLPIPEPPLPAETEETP